MPISLRKKEDNKASPSPASSTSSVAAGGALSVTSASSVLSTSPVSSPMARGRSESVSSDTYGGSTQRLSAENIEKIEKIGEGAFGEVWYVMVFTCATFKGSTSLS